MSNSTDYHDYVFKDGKLVGKFDEMYKKSAEIPWHQDKTAYKTFSDIDITILKQFKYNSICDIGCGLGYFANRLHKELNSKRGGKPDVTGVEISSAAVGKALIQFPEIRFIVGDVLKGNPLPEEKFDLVVVKEILWYVCHEINIFMPNIVSMLKNEGFLYVSQSFPESSNWIGKEIIDSPETLKSILARHTKPVHCCIEVDWNANENLYLHWLGQKKA
jgi:SAM-dependent methyltransferase